MYNKHEHFRQVKDVYHLTRICSEYVISKTVFALITIFFGHIISILYKITYQLERLLGKYALFFDKKKEIRYTHILFKSSTRWVLSIA